MADLTTVSYWMWYVGLWLFLFNITTVGIFITTDGADIRSKTDLLNYLIFTGVVSIIITVIVLGFSVAVRMMGLV